MAENLAVGSPLKALNSKPLTTPDQQNGSTKVPTITSVEVGKRLSAPEINGISTDKTLTRPNESTFPQPKQDKPSIAQLSSNALAEKAKQDFQVDQLRQKSSTVAPTVNPERIKAPETKTKPPKYTVAVIDNFTDKHTTVDNDNKPDVTHGKIVVDHLKHQLGSDLQKKVTIKELDAPLKLGVNASVDMDKVKKHLESIEADNKKGQRTDAVNLSLVGNADIGFLGMAAKIEDFKSLEEGNNLEKHRDTIRNKLDELNKTEDLSSIGNVYTREIVENWRKIKPAVDGLESLNPDTKVFISAGNKKEHINLFAFTRGKNISIVGGLEEDGKPSPWASNTSLNSTNERASFPFTPLYGPDGKTLLGVNYTGGNQIDVKPEELSSTDFSKKEFLTGTSYASPRSLANFIRDKEK